MLHNLHHEYILNKSDNLFTVLCETQVRIQDFAKGVPGSEAESCPCSEAETPDLWPGLLKSLEAFGFLMLKYAFSTILETLFLSFLTSTSTAKIDKNSTLHCKFAFHCLTSGGMPSKAKLENFMTKVLKK